MPKMSLVLQKKQAASRKYVVDRIEDDGRGNRIAVLENQDDGSSLNLPASRLTGAREGAMFSVPLRNGQPHWAMASRDSAGESARLADVNKKRRALPRM